MKQPSYNKFNSIFYKLNQHAPMQNKSSPMQNQQSFTDLMLDYVHIDIWENRAMKKT